MECSKIIAMIEERIPREYALEWDNVGLLAGRLGKEVRKILIALDATDEVIQQAVDHNVDMLITHHPLIFSPLKTITDQDFIGRRVVSLLQHDISYYAMHTNYDVMGMADLAGAMIGLCEPEVLEVTKEVPREEGIGRVGTLAEAVTLQACCEHVKACFGLSNVKVFGDLNMKVKRAAISPGSGKSVIRTAISKGAEVLITGDIDHHDGLDAVARGIAIIDAGHYGIEHIYVGDMEKYLKQKLGETVEIMTAEECNPFLVL